MRRHKKALNLLEARLLTHPREHTANPLRLPLLCAYQASQPNCQTLHSFLLQPLDLQTEPVTVDGVKTTTVTDPQGNDAVELVSVEQELS